MTDTVNVPREALELFDRAMRDADISFYHAARQTLHNLLAAAPKAVNVPDPASMDDAPAWYTYEEASGWACGWNACRDAALAAARIKKASGEDLT